MLDVFITIDTEIWCGGWDQLDVKFPEMFEKYVFGPTKSGDYALPKTLEILAESGLKASFFVEPLFAARFGPEPLHELVTLIQKSNQEIQLHLHPEWVDEAPLALISAQRAKTSCLTEFSEDQQVALMQWGLRALHAAGVDPNSICAFRAGSYSADRSTLRALQRTGINIDTSYNLASYLGTADLSDEDLHQPRELEGVHVYPVTVFSDGISPRSRHLQLSACSFREIKHALLEAHSAGWNSVVLVSHNFELLKPNKADPDHTMEKRFRQLCRFLAENKAIFNVRGFNGLTHNYGAEQPSPIKSHPLRTLGRYIEQAMRRVV